MRFTQAWLSLVLLACAAGASAAPPPADPPPLDRPQPYIHLQHPDWMRDAVLYEINIRQFTPEGTFRAAQAQLPRLKKLGVDVLWVMPVQPIGKEKRKGTLGSPYSVRDYYGVNPEFGTAADFKAFVAAAHAQRLRVILDWVPNHTAWDNPLLREHPDWYKRDWKGDFQPAPWFDWTDIVELDYTRPGLRRYMADALEHWLRAYDLDGFRMDVAGFIPLDFWNGLRRELEVIKPHNVLLLAEWESRDLHADAFDMTYAWTWWEAMRDIAKGHADVGALAGFYSWNEGFWPQDALRMMFVTNHDKNAWEGTGPETFGPMLPAAIALSVVGEGVPLVYNGQEAGETKRLKFFEHDPIDWKPSPIGPLYTELFALMKRNSALWHGHWGARMVQVPNSAPAQVLSFVRRDAHGKVFAVFNLSAKPQAVTFEQALFPGAYKRFPDGARVDIAPDARLQLEPWGYRIFEQQAGSGAP